MLVSEAHINFSGDFVPGMQEGQNFSPSPKKRSDYYPFGLQMPGRSSNTGNPNDNYKFTGHERDDEAGLTLDYMGARYYDPVVSRFMSIDPMADSYPGWSPYSYTLNNPVNLVDPTGECPENVSLAVCVGATIAGTVKAGVAQIRYNSARRIAIWMGSEKAKNAPYRRYGVYEDASSSTGVTVGYEEIYDGPSVGRRALDTGLAALDVTAISPSSSGPAMFAKMPGMFSSEFLKNASSAFREANSGGKHSGMLENVINTGMTSSQIKKSINSYMDGKRGILTHMDKISNPSKYVKNWENLKQSHQESLIKGWKTEIQNAQEKIDILNDLLNQ